MRSVSLVIVDRANYGRLAPVMEAIRGCLDLSLHVVCAGSSVLDRFACPADDIEQAGYAVSRLYHEVEGNLPVTMAKSVGAGVVEFAGEFARQQPDIVLLIGDRYEALSAAIAAAMMNLTLVHVQGGEVSGSIDESTRHAITKLAHYHVPATARARERILQMGERPETILTTGCPSSDLARRVKVTDGDHLLVVYHPTTTHYGGEREEMQEILAALEELKQPTLVFWPNADAGSDGISKAIRSFGPRPWLTTVKNLPPEEYLEKLASARCCVGNSSSFVRDAGFFGTPVVLVGDRQDGRERHRSVEWTECARDSIAWLVKIMCKTGRFEPSTLYGDGHVSERIVWGLVWLELYSQKRFNDLEATCLNAS